LLDEMLVDALGDLLHPLALGLYRVADDDDWRERGMTHASGRDR
jgi:hypothetical protein